MRSQIRLSQIIRFGFIVCLIGLVGTLPLWAVTNNYTQVTQNRQAIHQYIRTLNPGIPSTNSWTIADQLAGAGNTHQIDPKFIAAIVAVESRYNARAYNHGAAGLGQLMPGTARLMGIKDPYSVTDNAIGTTKYVRAQFDYFGKSSGEKIVLASYLQGPTRAKRQQGQFPNRVYRYIQSVMTHYDAIKTIFKALPPEPQPVLALIPSTTLSPQIPTPAPAVPISVAEIPDTPSASVPSTADPLQTP